MKDGGGAGTVKELENNGQKYNYYYPNGWTVTKVYVNTTVSYKQGGELKNVIYGVDENEFTEGSSDGTSWVKKVVPLETLISEW